MGENCFAAEFMHMRAGGGRAQRRRDDDDLPRRKPPYSSRVEHPRGPRNDPGALSSGASPSELRLLFDEYFKDLATKKDMEDPANLEVAKDLKDEELRLKG